MGYENKYPNVLIMKYIFIWNLWDQIWSSWFTWFACVVLWKINYNSSTAPSIPEMFQGEETWMSMGFLKASGQLPTCLGRLAKYSTWAYLLSFRFMTKSQHEFLVKSVFVPVLCLSETLKELNLAGRFCLQRGMIIKWKNLIL